MERRHSLPSQASSGHSLVGSAKLFPKGSGLEDIDQQLPRTILQECQAFIPSPAFQASLGVGFNHLEERGVEGGNKTCLSQ